MLLFYQASIGYDDTVQPATARSLKGTARNVGRARRLANSVAAPGHAKQEFCQLAYVGHMSNGRDGS
jgi:hypothetical protein